MTQSSTEQVIAYWRSRKRGALAPRRSDIDPSGFPKLLPQVFMLGRHSPGDYGFRLVGGLIADLHKRDLRGVSFINLWAQHGRLPIQTALEQRRRQAVPLLLSLEAQAAGHTLPIFMTLMPLGDKNDEVDRYLGVYEPLAPLARLHDQPVDRLSLLEIIKTGEANEPQLRLAAVGGLSVD